MDNLKIGIVGGGNIGKCLSTLLIKLGYDVELASRISFHTLKVDNSCAFEIEGDFGSTTQLIPTVESMENFSSLKDIIFFTTRAYETLEYARNVLNFLTTKGTVVTIQNVFSIDKLIGIIPNEASVCMVCDFACVTNDKKIYVKNSNGFTLGVYNKKAVNRMKLVEKILSGIARVQTTSDIFGFAMSRNILNGAISALGAISGLRLKEILNSRRGQKLFCSLIKEAVIVCKRYRIKVLPYNDQLDYDKFISSGIDGMIYRHKILKVLKEQNGNIKSSALDDIEHKRKTELRYMLDTLLSYGSKTKTDIRYLKAIDQMLKEIEDGVRKVNINAFFDKKLLLIDKN